MQRTGGLQHSAQGDGGGELVYVVHPLPETLLDSTWDYGTLRPSEEQRYVESMPVQSTILVPLFAARTLNATGQSRVTLSLR